MAITPGGSLNATPASNKQVLNYKLSRFYRDR